MHEGRRDPKTRLVLLKSIRPAGVLAPARRIRPAAGGGGTAEMGGGCQARTAARSASMAGFGFAPMTVFTTSPFE
jgi:hypothetical protein